MGEKFLRNKVAIVTGGARGIGRAIVLMLANEGCHVSFNYVKNQQAAQDLKVQVEKCGVKCLSVCADIKDFKAVKEWVELTKKEFGQLDILINNAGIIIDKALMLMSPEEWHDVIETNLTGVFNATRLCIIGFLKQKSGNVINISSLSGIIGLSRQVNYSASKGGINAFTKALAREVAAYGVRVNAVAPGFTETEILDNMTLEQKQKLIATIPLGRIGHVNDVANCVKFLLSEDAQYMTGQIIQVDGGLGIR